MEKTGKYETDAKAWNQCPWSGVSCCREPCEAKRTPGGIMGACAVCGRTMDGNAQFCSGCGRLLAPGTTHRVVTYPERLVRPREDRMIAGVCAAFALRYGWDLALVRLVLVLALIFGCGLPLLVYLAAWIAIPNAQHALPAQAGAGPGSMAM